jgi:hypothetical protein
MMFLSKGRASLAVSIMLCLTAVPSFAADTVDSLLAALRSYTQEDRSIARLSMEIVRKERATEYELRVWSEWGRFVSRVESPSVDKGTMYLSSGGNSWIYYPSIEKTIRTSASQKLLGSDFSFNEITGLDFARDYDLALADPVADPAGDATLRSIVPDDIAVSMTATAKSGVKVPYPKVVISFDAFRRPAMEEFFTLSGQRLGIVLYRDYGTLGERIRAREIVAYTAIKKDEYTRMRYLDLDTSAPIDAVYFTAVYLPKLSGGK